MNKMSINKFIVEFEHQRLVIEDKIFELCRSLEILDKQVELFKNSYLKTKEILNEDDKEVQ